VPFSFFTIFFFSFIKIPTRCVKKTAAATYETFIIELDLVILFLLTRKNNDLSRLSFCEVVIRECRKYDRSNYQTVHSSG